MPQRLMLACSTFTRLAENSLARMPPALPIRAAIWVVFDRGGGNVHHPFGLPVIGEQGGDRQHRTGFLNIEQPAEMFGGTAQRQRVVILSLDPESLCAPGTGASCQP